jgi:hypothetical protein
MILATIIIPVFARALAAAALWHSGTLAAHEQSGSDGQ